MVNLGDHGSGCPRPADYHVQVLGANWLRLDSATAPLTREHQDYRGDLLDLDEPSGTLCVEGLDLLDLSQLELPGPEELQEDRPLTVPASAACHGVDRAQQWVVVESALLGLPHYRLL